MNHKPEAEHTESIHCVTSAQAEASGLAGCGAEQGGCQQGSGHLPRSPRGSAKPVCPSDHIQQAGDAPASQLHVKISNAGLAGLYVVMLKCGGKKMDRWVGRWFDVHQSKRRISARL